MKDKKLGRFEKKKGCYWGTEKKKKARLSTAFTFLQPGEGVMHSPKDVDFGDFPPIFYAWPSCGHQAPFQNTMPRDHSDNHPTLMLRNFIETR